MKENCLNCKYSSNTNYIDNKAIDTWCKKHNTNFTALSKCDMWDKNSKL